MSTIDKASLIQIPSGYKNGKLYSVKPTPTYGSELVTNGDFSGSSTGWTESGTWTYGNNNEVCTGNGTNQILTQSGILTTGKKYKYSIDIISSTLNAQEIRFYLGGTDYVTYTLNGGAETISAYAEAAGANLAIRVTSSNTSGVLTIDNVSVKEITNIGDFNFSRSSSGTRVNSEGLIETAQVVSTTELVTNGDFATDSDWTKGSGWTISGGKATKSGSDLSYLTQSSLISVVGKTYRVKASITNVTTGNIRIDNFTSGTTYTSNVEIDITYTATSAGVFRFLGWGGFDGSIDNVSVKEVIENDVPRLDYSDGSCPSLLLEPQSTNTVTYSEDFSQWGESGSPTLTSGQLAPDGTLGATKISGTIGSSYIALGSSSSTTATRSIYARTVSGTGTAKLMSFNSNTNNLFTLTEEWQRFELTGSTSVGGTSFYIDLRDSSQTLNEFIIWGAQSEELSYATSYIPSNSGSSTTRTADVCNNAGTSATFNSTEGVLFAEIAALVDDGTNRILSLSEDGNNNNRVTIFYTSGSNKIKFTVRLNGANEFDETITLSNILDYNKVALKFAENNFAVYINGVKEEEQLSGSIYSANTLDKLSFDKGDGSLDFYGKTKQLMTFDEALSDEELSDLTGQVNLSFNNLATFYNYTIL